MNNRENNVINTIPNQEAVLESLIKSLIPNELVNHITFTTNLRTIDITFPHQVFLNAFLVFNQELIQDPLCGFRELCGFQREFDRTLSIDKTRIPGILNFYQKLDLGCITNRNGNVFYYAEIGANIHLLNKPEEYAQVQNLLPAKFKGNEQKNFYFKEAFLTAYNILENGQSRFFKTHWAAQNNIANLAPKAAIELIVQAAAQNPHGIVGRAWRCAVQRPDVANVTEVNRYARQKF